MPSEDFPNRKRMRWYYRGPDKPGTHLSVHEDDDVGAAASDRFVLELFVSLSHDLDPDETTLPATTVTIARYDPSGIYSTADLAALNPQTDPVSRRIETLVTVIFPSMIVDINPLPTTGWFRRIVQPLNSIVLNRFAGPQLVGIELMTGWSAFLDSDKFRVDAQLVDTTRVVDGLRNLQLRALA